MPCEACNVQFTVFRRKKSCTECRRLYCNQCLIKRKDKILCDRCVVFTTRPISKIDLLKLKPKDLIFYLQSKHISTTGCVEKEELVNLVLIHANSISADTSNRRSSSQFSEDNFSNPFDQIKQTCQNLFTSFTDKIASDLNFDTKPSPSGQNENIFSQPRASPTSPQQQYSFSHSSSDTSNVVNADRFYSYPMPSNSSVRSHRNSTASSGNSAVTSPTSATSPVINSSNSSSASTPSAGSKVHSRRSSQTPDGRQPPKLPTTSNRNEDLPSVHEALPRSRQYDKLKPNKLIDHIEVAANSECDCSDDETIAKFTKKYMKASPSNDGRPMSEPEPGPSSSSTSNGAMCGGTDDTSKTTKGDSSNASSFEEIACGTSSGDWLFVTKPTTTMMDGSHDTGENVESRPLRQPSATPSNDNSNASSNINLTHLTFQNVPAAHSSQLNINPGTSISQQPHVRRVVRRRSDGSIGSKLFVDTTMDDGTDEISEDETLRKRTKTSSCDKCGKSKRSLKRHIAKFKRQLETTNASEVEIKKQLEAFLEYLETCQKNSMDGTDTESNDDHLRVDGAEGGGGGDDSNVASATSPSMAMDDIDDDDDNYDFEYDEGIHVYGTDHDETKGTPRQFVNINDYENSSDLDDLSVKQLKEILMLNRVDFKGCCEKTELLERVKRLWNDLHSVPAIDKLPSDDLCKICMDAPIECVILECGHMATCTNCGKVLSECPICRQYIVRVVRFFRA